MKAFFLSRLLREKILLLAFTLLGAAIWLSGVGERVAAQVRAIRVTSTDLDVQQRWLLQRDRIEKEATLAVEHLDPSRSFDSVRLQGELNMLARSAGLSNYDVSDSRTVRSSQFAVHSVQFSARNSDMGALIAFYQSLTQRAPYLGLEQFSLASNRANASQLSASWRVTSVEIAR
ncbi:MAG: general secretion pathway protein GspM [Opitutus sp.]|nr:general secretion pathway protein GspM [Opitutus sp.]MCS6246436.1 general secretion pathway protein GspM [Opitutus sp.]MCS6273683.1 general secretion pathway protein GspM [Opitutus sp.]MCS6277930.1 general secretion pathway protein GspM [Opitutus sp.]MCS6298963.1 general secretion pathway protein GspM [Opitutus sp.]